MDGRQILDGIDNDRLAHLLEVGQIGIWELDIAAQSTWRNSRHDEIFGYEQTLPDWGYDTFLNHVVSIDRDAVREEYLAAIHDRREWSFECRILRKDGAERWISVLGKPVLAEDGSIKAFVGHVIDITHTKRNEEHLRLVTNELNHRVRNVLSLTKAMVGLSAKTATNISTFAKAVEGRVAALGRAHDLLAQHGTKPIKLLSIIDNELSAVDGFKSRMQVSGEETLAVKHHVTHSRCFALRRIVRFFFERHGAGYRPAYDRGA
ncbi:MAG: HWE histidine kinase domain-containing protein [Pseudomonadota bacterium]|nr:HWE histidine kinase domain-containing protein [Pseudomonadota bacterium]